MTTHHIPTTPAAPAYGPDSHLSTVTVRTPSRYTRHAGQRFTVMYIGPSGECRREFGGPILPGPYAALLPNPTIIDGHGVQETIVEAAIGDQLELGGQLFTITDDRPYGYPLLIPVVEIPISSTAQEILPCPADQEGTPMSDIPSPTRRVLDDIAEERRSWGQQSHPDGTTTFGRGRASMARREVRSAEQEGWLTWKLLFDARAAQAATETNLRQLRAALVDVAAVAAAWIEDVDQRMEMGHQ